MNNNISGSPRVLADYIEVLSEQGYPIDLYTNHGNGPLRNLPVRFFNTGFQWLPNKLISHANFFWTQFRLCMKLLSYKNADAIFLINTMLPFGAAISGKLIGKQVVYIVHETMIRPALFKQLCRTAITHTASHTIFVSRYTETAERIRSVPSTIIYPTVSKHIEEAAQRSIYQVRDGITVSMITSMQDFKGNHEFMAIARDCLVTSKIRFELLVSSPESKLDTLFPHDMRPSNVQIFSEQPNSAEFLARATILLNLTRPTEVTETFGLTILEALNFGIPCIVPPAGGPLELIDHESNGYCISSSETTYIAQLITELADSPQKLLELSSNAKDKAQQFSRKEFKSRCTTFFESLTKMVYEIN